MKRLCNLMKRFIYAEYVKINMNDSAIQLITDCMANSMPIQVEYMNSGWRTVQPYGWNTSKSGDLLMMCYKDNMDIRSYRFDRMLQIFVDESLLNQENNNDQNEDKNNPNNYIIPDLPDDETDNILEVSENEQGEDKPFDEAIDVLENGTDREFNDEDDEFNKDEFIDNINKQKESGENEDEQNANEEDEH